ncbi:MAG: nitroreductase family protein [Gammaproteobacteria bacterium]|nr:nitroreductase family protein [Gammaproteobacteria bacterium]MXW51406.1 nitroreductase family protein [Gammaproteobacteria bacterium]MYE50313.1 nitroreductase family protein [Gammaproteobacteria bacterium]MYF10040.1 nitroreductase family protein [Gammaproteobacteria bacterium]MYF51311.1 nitroreductase family protein [Gammaproteobacteria bacterium]
MAHEQLGLTNDELLSTTRAVRKRLDFDRPVGMDVIRECLELAVQAPTGSNAQGWQFVFVTDADKRRRIGEYYRQAYAIYRDMPVAIHKLHQGSGDAQLTASQARSAASADYLADNMGQAPVLMIPCIAGRTDNPEGAMAFAQTAVLGSVIPAAWNFMLAARARGLGTAWTTLHLMHEREIAELLGIPYADFMQVALMPIAYTKGTSFKPAYRPPIDSVMHVNAW